MCDQSQRMQWLVRELCDTQMATCYVLAISAPSQLLRIDRLQGQLSFENLQRAGILGINLNWLVSGIGPQWTDSDNAKKVQALLASGKKITIDYYYRELANPTTGEASSQTQHHKELP